MITPLLTQAIIKYVTGVIIVALLLFLPAWSLHYWQGWLLIAILFVPMLAVGIVIYIKNKELLKKRLKAKETDKTQNKIVKTSGLLFVISFIVAGFNSRYQWALLPNWAVWVAATIQLLSYIMYAEVLHENTYLSRTIEAQENQKVIDTGLYSIVRHPMYTATTILFLAMPIVLASPISFIIMLLYIPLIVHRIKTEETFLENNLQGYKEYQQRVKYRLIPFIW